MAWLEYYNHPTWAIGRSGLENAQRMHRLAGCWPEPIDVPVHPIPKEFNDPLPF